MSKLSPSKSPGTDGDSRESWSDRLTRVVETMREMSRQDDPQAMVRLYGAKTRKTIPNDQFVALSRRDLDYPRFRVTRFTQWTEDINPWTQKDRLPLLEGGLLGELIYGDFPRIIDDLHVAEDDPGFPYLRGMRSLLAIPGYDRGAALNMTIVLRKEPAAFDPEQFPEQVWIHNLFARATQNLVLTGEVRRAFEIVNRELKVVADIQRSLLPRAMPEIPTLDLAAHYQTSQWAGGDYYDFFHLPGDRWGVLIADVSGHGTPAAVLMAITHTITHSFAGPHDQPHRMLDFVNNTLARRYTAENEAFVTAFYGIYNPADRSFRYASAGHNPPRLKRCETGAILSLDEAQSLPLGLFEDQSYESAEIRLTPGDQIVFYTDGITEAVDPSGRMFGVDRLDDALEDCYLAADGLIQSVLEALDRFTDGVPPTDDRTILVAKVS